MELEILRKVALVWVLLALAPFSTRSQSSGPESPTDDTTTMDSFTASTESPTDDTTDLDSSTPRTESPTDDTTDLDSSTPSTESPTNDTTDLDSSTPSTESPNNDTTTPGSSSNSTGSPTDVPTPPGTSQPSADMTSQLTSTTTPSTVPFYLTYHIANREFDDTLLDPTSLYYSQMNETIRRMYDNIYRCPTCPRRNEYRGYNIIAFRPGSVAVSTVLFFETQETPAQLAETMLEIFEKSSQAQRGGLELISIQGSSTPIPVPEAPEPVPGWGIALLVLVCILLLLAIIAFLLLIIYRCRRSQRGDLDLLLTQDSYHPMSEYPTCHTRGRGAAPFNKPNPYQNQPSNGTSPFSYSNPSMATNNL